MKEDKRRMLCISPSSFSLLTIYYVTFPFSIWIVVSLSLFDNSSLKFSPPIWTWSSIVGELQILVFRLVVLCVAHLMRSLPRNNRATNTHHPSTPSKHHQLLAESRKTELSLSTAVVKFSPLQMVITAPQLGLRFVNEHFWSILACSESISCCLYTSFAF